MKNYAIFGVCRAFFYIMGDFGFMTGVRTEFLTYLCKVNFILELFRFFILNEVFYIYIVV